MDRSPRLYAFDDAAALWAELLSRWREDPTTTLVLPSRLAELCFLRQHATTTLWGERVISLAKLSWQVADRQDAGQPASPGELRAALAEELERGRELPEALRAVRHSDSALSALVSHLDDIESRADRDYRPTNEIERGIAHLRQQLSARELHSLPAFLSQVARGAEHVDLGPRHFLVASFGQMTRATAGLFKGLATHHQIDLFLLAGDTELDSSLRLSGLDDLPAPCLDNRISGQSLASELFGHPDGATTAAVTDAVTDAATAASQEPTFAGRPTARFVETTDEAEAIIELLQRWIAAGVSPTEIGVVLHHPDELSPELARLAARRQVPVLLRDQVFTRTSALGTLLLRLAELRGSAGRLDDPGIRADLLRRGQLFELRDADLTKIDHDLAAAPQHQQLAIYLALGEQLLARLTQTAGQCNPDTPSNPDAPAASDQRDTADQHSNANQRSNAIATTTATAAIDTATDTPSPSDTASLGVGFGGEADRGAAWLGGLREAVGGALGRRVFERDPALVLNEIASARQARGDLDGCLVVSYAEAPAFPFKYAIYGSLVDGRYPPPRQRSAFASPELLADVPQLADPSHRPEFTAAVAACSQEALFLREARDRDGTALAPSAFWQELRRVRPQVAVERLSTSELTSRRRLLQFAARERLDHEHVAEILNKTHRSRLPRGALHGTRTTFSVTELEAFARCPLGWFVGRVLRPHEPSGPLAQRGTAAHGAIELAAQALLDAQTAGEQDPMRLQAIARQAATDHLDRLLRASLAVAHAPTPSSSGQEQLPGKKLSKEALPEEKLSAEELSAEEPYKGELDGLEELPYISRRDRDLLIAQIEPVLSRYLTPAWPGEILALEHSFNPVTGLLPGHPTYGLRGRADRIDRLDDSSGSGLLLIDYKAGRRARKKSWSEKAYELQRYLYPLMAQASLNQDALGLIYVSVSGAEHDGSLSRPIVGVSNEHTDEAWSKDSETALAKVDEIIDRIEIGDFTEVGSDCASWCPHHLLSRTAEL